MINKINQIYRVFECFAMELFIDLFLYASIKVQHNKNHINSHLIEWGSF